MWRSTARGEGQVKGSGKYTSRLGPRHPKRPSEGRPTECTDQQANMKEGCSDVGRVGEDDGESNRQHVRRACTNDSNTSKRGGRSDMCRHQGGCVAAKRIWTIWVVWVSKPRCRQVSWFGPQNRGRVRCDWITEVEGTWRHRETCERDRVL